jgi:ADP-heptose:LPS heptosyltransferase
MAKRSLVVSLQGIGNALLALSLAKALHDAGDEVALLTLSPRALPLLQHAPQLNVVIAADAPMFRGAAGRARLLFELRRRRFDRAAFSFPSGANAYRLIRLAGVPQRFGHKYPEVGRASRLLTEALVPLRRGHDVDQNLQLAAALDLAHDPATHWPVLPIPNQRRDAARSYLT